MELVFPQKLRQGRMQIRDAIARSCGYSEDARRVCSELGCQALAHVAQCLLPFISRDEVGLVRHEKNRTHELTKFPEQLDIRLTERSLKARDENGRIDFRQVSNRGFSIRGDRRAHTWRIDEE